MSEIALASINSFAPSVAQRPVSPSEEQIFVLTTGQLASIVSAAIQEATEPILQEIQDLRARQERDYERFAGDICDHGQRLRKLEKIEPQPLQQDRGDILRALLAANDGKMLRSQARKKMHLSESRFSEVLATMGDYIEVRPYHLNKNQKVLVLK